MHVNEIVREEKLDEALPAIAGLSAPVILGYISAALTAYSAVQIYQFINKYQENPDDLSEDEWGNVFIDIAFAAVPAFARLGKPLILKMIPKRAKNWGGNWIKRKINQKLAKDQSKILKKYGPNAQKGRNPSEVKKLRARRRLELSKAKQRANQKLNSIKKTPIYDAVLSGLTAGIFGKLFLDYWEKRELLNEQYTRVNQGDLTGFDNMTKEQALQKIIDDNNKLVGELSIAVAAALTPLAAPKLVRLFGSFFGTLAPGGRYIKGAANLAANAITPLSRALATGGAGLAAFMQTDTGRKILETQIVQAITTMSGTVANSTYTALLNIGEYIANAAGVDASRVTNAMRPTIPAGQAAGQASTGVSTAQNRLQIKVDPRNQNIKFIDGKQVTGPDGYVLNTIPNIVRDIRRMARSTNQPDPFTQLQFDPNKQYTNLAL